MLNKKRHSKRRIYIYVVAGWANNRAEYLVLVAIDRGPIHTVDHGSPFLRDLIYPSASGNVWEVFQGETQEADDRFAVREQTVCGRSIKSDDREHGNEIIIRSRLLSATLRSIHCKSYCVTTVLAVFCRFFEFQIWHFFLMKN